MHPDWKAHLTASGLHPGQDETADAENEAAERAAVSRRPVLLDLTAGHALLRAGGADATTFLNGQLTNDIRRLESGGSLLAGYCTPQGRLLAIARVFRRGSDYYLQLPLELRDAVLERLRKYVMRAKVVLEPADPELIVFSLAGADSATLLARAVAGPAPGRDGSIESGDLTALRIVGPRDRFQVIAPVGDAKTLWRALQAVGAQPVAGHWWDWFDIDAGLPTVRRATQEKFVPQTVNLDLVGGVNFEKGCYPGQEIVARVHYLGRLKERMYRLHLTHAEAPQAGDAIYAPDFAGQATGTVVQAHAAPERGFDLLAIVHTSSIATAELHWRSPDGPRLELGVLPYPLPRGQS